MDNKERFIEIFTSQIHRPGAAEMLEWLESTDFFEAPASTHYHGSYPGGLVEHSLNVYYELIGAKVRFLIVQNFFRCPAFREDPEYLTVSAGWILHRSV